MAHRDKHPVAVDGCYNCKLLTVGVQTYNLGVYREMGSTETKEREDSLRRFEEEHGYPAERAR